MSAAAVFRTEQTGCRCTAQCIFGKEKGTCIVRDSLKCKGSHIVLHRAFFMFHLKGCLEPTQLKNERY